MPTRISSSTLFPYTTLFRSYSPGCAERPVCSSFLRSHNDGGDSLSAPSQTRCSSSNPGPFPRPQPHQGDRKSTRLNSSHVAISYAVYCMKKKKKGDIDHAKI